jgi:hydroxypyruvate isomerase
LNLLNTALDASVSQNVGMVGGLRFDIHRNPDAHVNQTRDFLFWPIVIDVVADQIQDDEVVSALGTLYADLSFSHTARDAFALADRIPGLWVDLDLFHVWTEPDLRDGISSHAHRISLVQVSDFAAGDRSLAARALPGDGIVPIEEILGWLSDAGYSGIVDLELNGPRIDEEGHLQAARRGALVLDAVLGGLRP